MPQSSLDEAPPPYLSSLRLDDNYLYDDVYNMKQFWATFASGSFTSVVDFIGIRSISDVSCSKPRLTIISSSEFYTVVTDI